MVGRIWWKRFTTKALVLQTRRDILDEAGNLIGGVRQLEYCRGEGSFFGPESTRLVRRPVPDRAPDAIYEIPTQRNQAPLIYRPSGDMNPLHADPQFAKDAGSTDQYCMAAARSAPPATPRCASPVAEPKTFDASNSTSPHRSFQEILWRLDCGGMMERSRSRRPPWNAMYWCCRRRRHGISLSSPSPAGQRPHHSGIRRCEIGSARYGSQTGIRPLHRSHRPDIPVLRNEAKLHVPSLAKKAGAFFRISLPPSAY